jgi:hypothetical protein
LQEFTDVFRGYHPFEASNTGLISYRARHFPTGLLTAPTLRRPRKFNVKYRSYLTRGTFEKA